VALSLSFSVTKRELRAGGTNQGGTESVMPNHLGKYGGAPGVGGGSPPSELARPVRLRVADRGSARLGVRNRGPARSSQSENELEVRTIDGTTFAAAGNAVFEADYCGKISCGGMIGVNSGLSFWTEGKSGLLRSENRLSRRRALPPVSSGRKLWRAYPAKAALLFMTR